MKKMNQLIKYPILFMIGGICYYFIEVLWRGYSYIVMFILGGLCFILIGLINELYFVSKKSLLLQQGIACIVITLLELVFGLVFNVMLGWNIWDYSKHKINFMGQICLKYTILWFFLSLPAIILYDYLKYWLFGEEKPNYKFI
ncbi:hypothetical protein C3E89_06425 [Clostridium sp. Cult1]|nr:putative ABC transporter permease [Clostridium sp. Cult1]MCF6463000.1 hypothetical protein [Clostridium sp. Cult1]